MFKKYEFYRYENNKIVDVNAESVNLADESFELFKSLFDTSYGTIKEDDNLISIHTGGWSENEAIISEFMKTYWWFKNHKITAKGGHYYFNTDIHANKEWIIKIETP